VNIEDYATKLKIKKKVFFDEFIAPLEDSMIDLTEADVRILATSCFLNSLTQE
jgi:hypothetical protein